MDRITSEHRSWNMSRIKGRDTKPELLVRSVLHRLGYRFRVDVRALPGRPDIVLPKHKTVIFVHGCFWHRHPGCRLAYVPKTRQTFWRRKFQDNLDRDCRSQASLAAAGWQVVVLWECLVKDRESIASQIANLLPRPKPNG